LNIDVIINIWGYLLTSASLCGTNADTGGTAEIHLGARKVFKLENSSWSPYAGAGVAIVCASLEHENTVVTVDDDETVVGAWVGVCT
jgi:hypothetical protein